MAETTTKSLIGKWDNTGERYYETGVSRGVLYPFDSQSKKYSPGVVWNGLISVTESPSGAEPNPMYADDIKYLNILSNEDFAATVEAYTYPPEFATCNGEKELTKGVRIGQQKRQIFGMCYRTVLGNDVDGNDAAYKLHFIYGALAAPSEKAYSSINDSPEATTFSWELSTTPVNVTGGAPTASLTIESTDLTEAQLKAIEDAIYGTATADPYLPLPDEVKALIDGADNG